MNKVDYLMEKNSQIFAELQNVRKVYSDIDHMYSQLEDISQDNAKLNDDLESLSNKANSLTEVVGEVSESVSSMSSSLNQTNVNVNALSSDLQDLATFAQGVSSTTNNLVLQTNTMTSTINTLSDGIDSLNEDVEDLSENISGLQTNYTSLSNSLTSNIDTINESIGDLSTEVETINTGIGDISQNVSGLQNNYSTLSSSLSTLNEEVDDISTDIDTINSNISSLTTEVNKANVYITAMNTDIESIVTFSQGLSTTVNDLTLTTNDLSTQIDTVEENVDSLSDNVSTLSSSMDSISTTIASLQGVGGTRNYLINSDFRVNQRGETTYNNSNAGLKKYTVDRLMHADSTNYSLSQIEDGGISIQNLSSSEQVRFEQIIEDGAKLLGNKEISLSISINNVVSKIEGKTLNIGNSQSKTYNGVTFGVEYTNDGKFRCYFILNSGLTRNINWWKLEISPNSTQFEPRLYVEELSLCQRYYQIFRAKSSFSGFGFGFLKSDSTKGFLYINFHTEMRAIPTLKASGSFRGYFNYTVTINRLEMDQGSTHGTNLAFYVSSAQSSFLCGIVSANNNSSTYIAFDAEIY